MTPYLNFILLFVLSTAVKGEALWPQFRGPNGDGVATSQNVPTQVDQGENLKWRTEIPGKAWSSPVVTTNSIWLTTAIEVKPSEEEREKLLSESGEEPKKFKVRQIAKNIRLLAIEIEVVSGEIKRQIELAVIEKPDAIHSLNSYASPTPFIDGEHLYAHFGTFGTFCLDTGSGEIVWQNQLPLEHGVGPGSSPFITGDLLILICDGVDQQYVTALDKNTGKEVWKKPRPEMRNPDGDRRKAYCTPIMIEPKGGVPQLICMGAQWLVSYEPTTGQQNWALDHGSGFSVVPRPVFSKEQQLIYISTGFGKPELWAVDTNGKEVWKDTKRIPAKPSPILVGTELYVINDNGIVSCFNSSDGKLHWSERLPGNYSASPLLVGEHLYFCNHEGQITVLKAGLNFETVSESQIDEQIMASPIALDQHLIIRSSEALYCFGNNSEKD